MFSVISIPLPFLFRQGILMTLIGKVELFGLELTGRVAILAFVAVGALVIYIFKKILGLG